MDGFIGREDELSKLDRLYRKRGSATCAVYGRRRVGKTSLLQQFCEGKPSLFMTVPGKDPDLTWDVLSAQASKQVGREVSLRSVPDLLGFLGEVGSAGNGDKTVVVLDEFPLLDEVDDSTAPLFQRFIDHDMKRFRLMLVVCGSSIRAMGRHLNDGDSPLYKRFILQMRIDPLPYPQACTFHRELSEEDRVRMFAVGSGIPAYHEYMEGMSVEQAITDGFLKEPALLRSEADSLVSLELKPKETYDRILASIREGVFDANDIEVRTGLTRPTCLAAIENLELLGVIREEVCYGKKRKRMFVVTDGFLDFYYDVALRSEPYGRFSRGEDVYGALGNRMATFFGRRFEEVCRQYLLGTERCRWIGRWWGASPVIEDGHVVRENGRVVTEDTDIDIVAEVENDHNVDLVLCVCKFTHRLVGMREYENLVNRGLSARKGYQNKRYVLFSRAGFTDELIEFAEDNPGMRIKLVTMDDIHRWSEGCTSGGSEGE